MLVRFAVFIAEKKRLMFSRGLIANSGATKKPKLPPRKQKKKLLNQIKI